MDAEGVRQVRIRVLGIGGAGSNALDRMLKASGGAIDYVAINTDRQDLAESDAPHKIQIGEQITHGLGAGGNPDVGRQAAMDSMAALEAPLEGCDLLFLVAGFGGGTGTGVSPVIAQMARERNILTVCIATTPFDFEGQKRKAQAMEGLRLVDEYADTVIVAPNDKLFQVADVNGSMKEAFEFTNDILAEGVQCIVRLISRTGLINLDFADVRTIVSRGGRAALGFGTLTLRETGGGEKVFVTSDGFFEINHNRAAVLVDTAEVGDKIDVGRAEDAKRRAEARLERRTDKSVDVARAEAALQRAIIRIKTAKTGR
jgi:cell division protein FtsZ